MCAASDNTTNNRSNIGPSRFFNRAANSFLHSDSINNENNTNEGCTTWIDLLIQVDRAFGGTLIRLCYTIIDILLLCFGLYYGTKTCDVSHAFGIISIILLICNVAELLITFLCFHRNWNRTQTTGSGATRLINNYQGGFLRSVFGFIQFIFICVGTYYTFRSRKPANNNCEMLRFYLGILCFSRWAMICISPPKPTLPIRRSLVGELFVFIFSTIFNIFYFGFVAFAMINTDNSKCIYHRPEDLYFNAPLKSFAYVGLILAVCRVVHVSIATFLNQLYYRLSSLRKFFLVLTAVHYFILYFLVLIIVYYYSIGAILLFQSRLGGSCAKEAPKLYNVLWIWQIIQVFYPLIFWPLVIFLCCLGVTFGACLAYCLPASITVPFVRMLGERFQVNTNLSNENPPATPGTIDMLPVVVFGQAPDEFNQQECAICQTNYEPNEKVKKLPCGHIFHQPCVAHWLAITRICPVCRHRISSDNL